MAAFAATLERGPIELRELRQSLRSWLELTTAAARIRDSVVLATHEATANAMVHGRQGSAVTISARQEESGDIAVEVSNLLAAGRSPRQATSGRGLEMMRELMREVEIQTTVRMRSGS
jgi:two-component sensor histidine kinase